jgi:hypothetical protein
VMTDGRQRRCCSLGVSTVAHTELAGALRIERPPFNRVMISRAERSRELLGDRKVYGGAFRLTSIELPRCCR